MDKPGYTGTLEPMTRSEAITRNPSAVFYGWWIVLASAVGLFWGPPVVVYSFSVFLKPLMQEFHVGRGAISLALTLSLVAAAATAPLTGCLIDRYGPRRITLLSTAFFGVVLFLSRILASHIWELYLFYLLLGLLINGVGPIPYGTVVSHWFDRQRGLALGLIMVGIGCGAIVLPSLAQGLIARLGWRGAYEVLGAAVLLIPIPVVAGLLRDKPQDTDLLPDGRPPKESARTKEFPEGVSASEAWQSTPFWIMVSAFFLVSASVQGCLIHMTAMLNDHGMTLQTAALGSSLMGVAVLVGRVGVGYLLDRLFAPRVAAVFFGAAALGIGFLGFGSSSVSFAGAFLVGLGLGSELDVIGYLVSRYFGLASYGKIYSLAFAAFALAGALGPLIMGAGFDITGSYRTPLAIFVAACLIAAVLMAFLGPYRYRASAST